MKLEALSKKNMLIESIFKNNDEYSAWIKDLDGVIIASSKTTLKLLALNSEDEIIGKTDYDFFDKELADHFVNQDKQVIESKSLFYMNRDQVSMPTGIKTIETFKAPMFDDDGNVVATLGFARVVE